MLQSAEQRMLWRHMRMLMFKPKYFRAVLIAILIPQMSTAMPQALWRSFVMEKTFLFPLRGPSPEGFSPWCQMESKAVLRPLWLSHPLQCIAWDVIPFPRLSCSTQRPLLIPNTQLLCPAPLGHFNAEAEQCCWLLGEAALPPVPASPPCFQTFL